MPVQLIKQKNQLIIRSVFNYDLVNILRKCDEREYKKSTREWIIPADRESWITRELEEANIDYDPVIKSNNNKSTDVDLSIEKKRGRLQLTFNKYCEEYPLFRAIANSEYDKQSRILSFPENQEKNLLNVLKDSKVTYSFLTANETYKIPKKSYESIDSTRSLKRPPMKQIRKSSIRSKKHKESDCEFKERDNVQDDTNDDDDDDEAEVTEDVDLKSRSLKRLENRLKTQNLIRKLSIKSIKAADCETNEEKEPVQVVTEDEAKGDTDVASSNEEEGEDNYL